MRKAERYIDRAGAIDDDVDPTSVGSAYIWTALRWLDEHPDQVPGRTITESKREAVLSGRTHQYRAGWVNGFREAGGEFGPDPEPTNAEKIEALLRAADESNADQEFGRFARYLDERGVKAPEAKEN